MRIYRLYLTGNSSTNNAANVQILQNTRIKSVRWNIAFDSITDGAHAYLEASLQGSAQAASNNTVGVFSAIRAYSNFVTSGLAVWSGFKQDMLDCPARQGDLIYINTVLVSGTIAWIGDIFLDCTN